MCREIAGNKVDLRMVGVAAAGARDAISRMELLGSFPHGNDLAGAAVSKIGQRIELGADLLVRGSHTILPRVGDHLFDQIGTCFRFGEERLGTQLQRGALGARADRRIFGAYQHAARAQLRWGNFGSEYFP